MDDTQRMLAERMCERLVAQYGHFIDHGQATRVAELFTEDGVWASSDAGAMNGREAIRAGFKIRQDRAERVSRHVCCNSLIEVQDESHAQGVAYVILYRHDAAPGNSVASMVTPAIVGEYRDTFFFTAEGWRFRRRDFIAAFSEQIT